MKHSFSFPPLSLSLSHTLFLTFSLLSPSHTLSLSFSQTLSPLSLLHTLSHHFSLLSTYCTLSHTLSLLSPSYLSLTLHSHRTRAFFKTQRKSFFPHDIIICFQKLSSKNYSTWKWIKTKLWLIQNLETVSAQRCEKLKVVGERSTDTWGDSDTRYGLKKILTGNVNLVRFKQLLIPTCWKIICLVRSCTKWI